MPRFQCRRCCRSFQNDEELSLHQKADISCLPKREEEPREGVTTEQERALKQRRNGRKETEKWYDMYRILFPNENRKEYPSPCEFFSLILPPPPPPGRAKRMLAPNLPKTTSTYKELPR